MDPINTFIFTRQLEDGSMLEVSMSFRIACLPNGRVQVAVADVVANTPTGGIAAQKTQSAETKLPKETDAQYLQRLIKDDKAEPRILSKWAKHLKISLRKLTAEKKAGLIKFTEKRETRAGNAHLITVEEMIAAVERLSKAA